MRYAPIVDANLMARLRSFVKEQRNFRRLNLTIDDVAEALGVSRSTITKLMREQMQCSFAEYLCKVRVQHGRHLIMTNRGRFTLEHIAVVSGFATLRTFSTKYKAAYGELPSETNKRKLQHGL